MGLHHMQRPRAHANQNYRLGRHALIAKLSRKAKIKETKQNDNFNAMHDPGLNPRFFKKSGCAGHKGGSW